MEGKLLTKDENIVDYVITNFAKLKNFMIVLDKPLFDELVCDCKNHNGFMEKYTIPDSSYLLGFYELKYFKGENLKHNILPLQNLKNNKNVKQKFSILKHLCLHKKKKKYSILLDKNYNKKDENVYMVKNKQPPKKEVVREILISNEFTLSKPLMPIYRLVSIQDNSMLYKSNNSSNKIFLTKNEKLLNNYELSLL